MFSSSSESSTSAPFFTRIPRVKQYKPILTDVKKFLEANKDSLQPTTSAPPEAEDLENVDCMSLSSFLQEVREPALLDEHELKTVLRLVLFPVKPLEQSFAEGVLDKLTLIFDGMDVMHLWKELCEAAFSGNEPDNARLNLERRKKAITSEGDHYYSVEKFSDVTLFEEWKNRESDLVQQALQSLEKHRAMPVIVHIEYKLVRVTLNTKTSKKKKKNIQVISSIVGREGDNEIECVFEPGHGYYQPKNIQTFSFDSLSDKSQLRLTLEKKRKLKKNAMGSSLLEIGKLIPQRVLWGQNSTEVDLDIIEGDNVEGTITLSVTTTVRRIPIGSTDNEIETDEEEQLDAHNLFKNLMESICKNYSLDHASKWIIEEFCQQYGITDLTQMIVIMESLTVTIDALLRNSDQFCLLFDVVTELMRVDPITSLEIERFSELRSSLICHMETFFSNFIVISDSCNVGKDVIRKMESILKKIDKHASVEEYDAYFKDMLRTSMQTDYQMLRQEETAPVQVGFSRTVNQLSIRVLEILEYTTVLDKKYEFEALIIDMYYGKMKQDFEQICNSEGFSGHQILHFAEQLTELNETIEEYFEMDVEYLDPSVVTEGAEAKCLDELKEMLITRMYSCVKVDFKSKWKVVNEDNGTSGSVVDFFTFAFHLMERISLKNRKVYKGLVHVFASVVVEYAQLLQKLCVSDDYNCEFKDMKSLNEMLVKDTSFVLLSNIRAARNEYRKWHTEYRDRLKGIDEEEDESGSDSDLGSESTERADSLIDHLDDIEEYICSRIISPFEALLIKDISQLYERIISSMKSKHSKLSPVDIIDEYRALFDSQFSIFFKELIPSIEILDQACHSRVFNILLKSLLSYIFEEFYWLQMQPAKVSIFRSVIVEQLIMRSTVFFHNSGDGLPHKVISEMRMVLDQLNNLFDYPSSSLIDMYSNLPITIQEKHVLAALLSLSSSDSSAKGFFKTRENKLHQIKALLAFRFSEMKEQVLLSGSCDKGTFWVTSNSVLWAPLSCTPCLSKFRSVATGTDTDGKFKILLADIKSIRHNDSLLKGSVEIYASNMGKKIMHMGSSDRSKMIEIIQKDHEVTVLPPSGMFASSSEEEVFIAGIPSAKVVHPMFKLDQNLESHIQDQLGFKTTLIDHCICYYSETNPNFGTLYLLQHCLCFTSYPNGVSVALTETMFWNSVVDSRFDDEELTIELQDRDGRRMKFHHFLTNFSEIAYTIRSLLPKHDQLSDDLYFREQFSISDDTLLEKVSVTRLQNVLTQTRGLLYIGEKNLCFEDDNTKLVIPIKRITNLVIQYRKITRRYFITAEISQKELRFILKANDRLILDLLKERIDKEKQ